MGGSHEGDRVRRVDGASGVSGGLDEIERHHTSAARSPGPLATLVRCGTVAKVDSKLSCRAAALVAVVAVARARLPESFHVRRMIT